MTQGKHGIQEEVAQVTDFGLAKAAESLKVTVLEAESKATAGTALPTLSCGGGTPRYMAPEQFPEAILNYYNYPLTPVSTRSDIYAFGLVLYEMFTRKHVFKADPSRESVIAQEAKVLVPLYCSNKLPVNMDRL